MIGGPERELTSRDQAGSFAMVFMMEQMAHESHESFMDFPVSTQTDIMDEKYHELRFDVKMVLQENMHVGQDSFGQDLEEEDPNR